MTFFEKELRKIIEPLKLGAVYVGGKTAYIPLPDVKIRVEFAEFGYADHWSGLRIKAIHPKTGDVDSNSIKFADVWGFKRGHLPGGGVNPHAWTYRNETEWYAYHPTESDYKTLTNEVKKFVSIYC